MKTSGLFLSFVLSVSLIAGFLYAEYCYVDMHIIRHRLALCGFIFTGVFLWLVGYIVYQLLAEKREGKIKKEEKEKFRTKAQTVEAL